MKRMLYALVLLGVITFSLTGCRLRRCFPSGLSNIIIMDNGDTMFVNVGLIYDTTDYYTNKYVERKSKELGISKLDFVWNY